MITSITEKLVESVTARYGSALTKINLSKNGLRSIENISRISTQLENLNLSQNSLADIRPIAQVKSLKYLNLANNSISDLHGMSSLLQLEMLDLSNNCISSCAALETLVALTGLRELNLAGNAVCSCIGYPAIIFSCIPTLQHLDGLSREQLRAELDVAASTDSRKKQPNLSATLDLRPKVSDSTSASKVPDYLQAQVSAMEHAFELQERSLSGNAAADIEQTYSSTDTAVLPQIPYLKILQLWRYQAHNSMTQLCAARRTIREQASELKAQRSLSADAVRDAQLNALSWRERTLAAEQKACAAEAKLFDAGQAFGAEQQRSRDLETETLAARKSLSSLRSYLGRSVSQLQEHTVGALLTVKKATAKLDAQKARIASAAERVAFAAALVAQREVQLRNSLAMQALSQKHDEETLKGIPKNDQFVTTLNKLNSREKQDVLLRPEAEALLSTLFRTLDKANTGLVSRELLLLCITESGESGGQLSELSSLVALVKEVMGVSIWTNANAGLRSLDSAEITWGEFLHLLVCPSQIEQGAALDYNERAELDRTGVWGDIHWGAIPLDLNQLSPDSIQKSEISVSEAEVRRLAGERAALLKTIQGLTITMLRRAEMCKAHFLRETHAIKLQNTRLQDQVATLRDNHEATATRHNEAVQSLVSQKERLEAQLLALEAELKEVRDRETERSAYESEQAENTVLVEKSKYQALEREYDLMQQEIVRKEILNKGLQRDARRAAASMSSVLEEKEKLEGELIACERQLAFISKEHENKLDNLQKDSQTVLDDLRAQLVASERVRHETRESAADKSKQVVEIGINAVRSFEEIDGSVEDTVLIGLRSEMEEIRSLKKNDLGSGQSGVYAAHLEKLLRLAEDAIGH